MGIYDRDYQRGGNYDRQPGFHLGGAVMMTTRLIIITGVVFAAQLLSNNYVTQIFILYDEWFREPWQGYRLLTYGFLHDPNDLKHILFNMLGLWFFGYDVEGRYGRREFLLFYLAAIIFAGLIWTVSEVPNGQLVTMLGASGAVTAVVVLFAFNFPHRTALFMFVIPMPMWVAAMIFVALDAFGAVNRSGNVAFTAHLGGALFAFLYYQWRWRLERWLPSGELLARLKPSPKLRVHDPEDAEETERQVDEILKKIQEHGRDSLTRSERRLLEEASREYQKKRR